MLQSTLCFMPFNWLCFSLGVARTIIIVIVVVTVVVFIVSSSSPTFHTFVHHSISKTTINKPLFCSLLTIGRVPMWIKCWMWQMNWLLEQKRFWLRLSICSHGTLCNTRPTTWIHSHCNTGYFRSGDSRLVVTIVDIVRRELFAASIIVAVAVVVIHVVECSKQTKNKSNIVSDKWCVISKHTHFEMHHSKPHRHLHHLQLDSLAVHCSPYCFICCYRLLLSFAAIVVVAVFIIRIVVVEIFVVTIVVIVSSLSSFFLLLLLSCNQF